MKTLRNFTYIRLWFLRPLVVLLLVVITVQGGQAVGADRGGADSALNPSITVKRDPFWPVGYIPDWIKNAGKSAAVIESGDNGNSDWNAAMKLVVIQGVSSRSGSEFFAVINDQIKSIGEAVSVKYGNNIYSWAVESISPPSSVTLRRVSVK